MSTYTGNTITIARPRGEVWDRLANLGGYQAHIDRLPDDVKAKIGDVRFTDDAIIIKAAPVGEVALRLAERVRPDSLSFEAEGSPVPLHVNISLEAAGEGETLLTPSIDVDVPPMLRPFVAPKMQQAADQMGKMLGNLFGE